MAQVADNINSVSSEAKPKRVRARAEAASGEKRPMVSVAWFILLFLLLGIFFGVTALWFDLFGSRMATVSLLQSLDPGMRARETWLLHQEESIKNLETDVMAREAAVAKREKDVDKQIMLLDERIKQFEEIQKDPDSPQELQALYLAQVLVNMSDRTAAELLAEMNDINQVLRVFKYLKEEKIATIMAAMEIDYAAQISKAILGRDSY